jgi:hypothetical protein
MALPDTNRNEELWHTLAKVMAFTTDEPILHSQLEEFFSPKPAKLAESKAEESTLNRRIGAASEALGGPPELIVQGHNDPKPRYDTYPGASFEEALAVFHRARRSIIRAHVSFLGFHMNQTHSDLYTEPMPDDVHQSLLRIISGSFWEHAEISLIRLAAYWDRVGQILDFSFFRIRQFERDGFASVVDRIHNNWASVDPVLSEMPGWKHIRQFQSSEKQDGLKWLVRRRNLLVHSLHLRPIEPEETDPIFETAFNHLDKSLKEKLAPGSMQDELNTIHAQLAAAAKLFPEVLSLVEHSARRTFKSDPGIF